MSMSPTFKARAFPNLKAIATHYGTPFHLYDEAGIRETAQGLFQAFSGVEGFREYFAVKALPNPRILSILHEMGLGFDCSSIPELHLSRSVGACGNDIMFTSNNTSLIEFQAAASEGGSILNLDDISLLEKAQSLPELISFRYNPGARRTGNAIIGNPVEAKYGITHDQFLDAYRKARDMGVEHFGLHTMLVSNELDHRYMVETIAMLLELTELAESELGIRFEFINMGGGLGIPYRPEDAPLDIQTLGSAIARQLNSFKQRKGCVPKLFMESGRYVTGPHGILVTRAINHKETYRHYVGVDASMSSLMRPGMYGVYHHIDVLGKSVDSGSQIVDVVGSLCENNDKFAIQRALPHIDDGDLLVIHDTGAHGHSMGFNYNGRLRPQELLLHPNGSVELIRRAETLDDYLATLTFDPDRLDLSKIDFIQDFS
ncbi:MAG: diaminopimelate decarboxylase [Chloroflexota bacterium]